PSLFMRPSAKAAQHAVQKQFVPKTAVSSHVPVPSARPAALTSLSQLASPSGSSVISDALAALPKTNAQQKPLSALSALKNKALARPTKTAAMPSLSLLHTQPKSLSVSLETQSVSIPKPTLDHLPKPAEMTDQGGDFLYFF